MIDYRALRLVYLFLLGITLISILACEKTARTGIGSRGSKSLSSHVRLHRTSAKDVIVTDEEGFGIVPGNVQRISMTSSTPKSIVIEFLPFETKSPLQTAEYALIDLATGNVSALTPQQANEATHFVSASEILPP
jgi:hypothetical protein